MRHAWLLIVMLTTSLPVTTLARDYSSMYSKSTLQQAHNTYSSNIQASLYQDIAGYLSQTEIATLRRVTLSQPWNRTQDPFEFSANPTTGEILVPTLSVKFLDDLAIAIAWFERFGCNKEAVFDYVAALDFNSRPLPAPLVALNVPEQAYNLDSYVDDVSQKALKSALAFLLIHELGHVHHQHRGYGKITAAQAQAQETEADLFALKVLRRMRLPPMGMALWFTAVSMRDPLSEGSPSQTHPLTASRLQAIATELRRNPVDFIEPANRGKMTADTIRSIASEFDNIGNTLADPNLRSLVRERGRQASDHLLKTACNAKQHQQDWQQKFKSLFE